MNRTTRTLLVLGIALAAAFAASYAVYVAIQRMPARKADATEVQTVVAARRVVVGTMLSTADVKLIAWPAKSQVPASFTSIDKVLNRGAVVSIAENEPITEDKLAPLNSGAGLPPTIKPGMRAISVKVNEVIGVAGFVVPGTRVDVVVSVDTQGGQTRDPMARVVVSNVEVLTSGTKIDQEKARKDGQAIAATVVTLMVTPEDAEKITLASSNGRIMLTLRNPLDTDPSKTSGVKLATLLGPAAPPPVEKTVKGRKVMVRPVAVAPPTPAPPPYTVEKISAAKRTEEVIK